MTVPLILDASALLAVAKGELGDTAVLETIERFTGSIFIHAINAFEVACKLMAWGYTADAAWELCNKSGAITITDLDDRIRRTAATLKTRAQHLSLGDCFCLALTERMGGCVITSDKGFTRVSCDAEVILFR